MEEIKAPVAIFRQRQEMPSIPQRELERTLLEMYYENSEARHFIEDLAVRLNLNMGLEQLRKHLEDVEKYEEVEKDD